MGGCLKCGQDNPEGFRFCGACGSPLVEVPRHPAGEERKVVTVLFCDLVGFTARSDRADPEDVGAMLRPFHARLRAEIGRVGGTLDKLIGVNTGEALVALECAADSEGVVGDVVNTAARLQGVAPVSGVVVGEATWRATRHCSSTSSSPPSRSRARPSRCRSGDGALEEAAQRCLRRSTPGHCWLRPTRRSGP